MRDSSKIRETLDQLLQRYVDEETYSFGCLGKLEVNAIGRERETPLHMAVTRNAIDDVKILLAGGADVNARTNIGSTPLSRAVGTGNIELVQTLLEAGANADTTNDFGESPLSMALTNGRQEIADLLVRCLGRRTAT